MQHFKWFGALGELLLAAFLWPYDRHQQRCLAQCTFSVAKFEYKNVTKGWGEKQRVTWWRVCGERGGRGRCRRRQINKQANKQWIVLNLKAKRQSETWRHWVSHTHAHIHTLSHTHTQVHSQLSVSLPSLSHSLALSWSSASCNTKLQMCVRGNKVGRKWNWHFINLNFSVFGIRCPPPPSPSLSYLLPCPVHLLPVWRKSRSCQLNWLTSLTWSHR